MVKEVLEDASAEASRGICDETKKDNAEIIETTSKEETPKQNEEAKPKAKPKKQARSVKVVELVECKDCRQKLTPKSLRYTHPNYCKGQPRETPPVKKNKKHYKEQKLRSSKEKKLKKR